MFQWVYVRLGFHVYLIISASFTSPSLGFRKPSKKPCSVVAGYSPNHGHRPSSGKWRPGVTRMHHTLLAQSGKSQANLLILEPFGRFSCSKSGTWERFLLPVCPLGRFYGIAQ